MQTDSRWKNKPYRVKGENSTIGGSGCGPSCAAMVIETLTGKTYTPEDACAWSVSHGYKALNQGTYYSYFKPQFEAFGIKCDQLNWTNTYGYPNHSNHEKALSMLKNGYYIIACMGKGLWTSSGHFVLLWWQDGKVRINDPASKKEYRLNGDIQTFRSQVKYYWLIDARSYNTPQKPPENHNSVKVENPKKEEKEVTQEDFNKMMNNYLSELSQKEDSKWGDEWEDAKKWAEESGIIKGDQHGNKMYQSFATRQSLALILYRLMKDK